MINHLKLIVLVAGFMLPAYSRSNSLDYQSVWQCDTNKFNWYCDQEEQKEQKPAAIAAPPVQPVKSNVPKRLEIPDIKTAEQLRVELKRREDLMVMNPENQTYVKDYLVLWQMTQDKGSMLADTWRRVVWQNPELDYSLRRPSNNAAIKVYNQANDQKQDQLLRDLAKEHGLIFFFRSDCPYCHAMAPTMQMLSSKYGVEVLPVSIDGKGIKEFPNPRDGRAQAAQWGVERVPAVFIGDKLTGERAPVGFGIMSFTEMVERIFVLTGTKPGEQF